MSESRARWVVALIGAAAFSFESWAFGPYSWMYGYGGGVETIPTHLALHFGDRLFSPWAPFIAGGLDRYAFWGNADPLNWDTLFLAVFPPWLGNGLHRFTQYFIAIYFTALLCSKHLGTDARISLLGGVLYACFSYFTFGEMLALPALPMFLLLVQYSRESNRGLWLPFVIGLGFSTFTTFAHSVPYFAVFGALWTAVVVRDVSFRSALNLALIVIGLTIGDAPQLLALIANAGESHREGFPPEVITWSIDSLFYRQLRFDYFNQDVVLQPIAWQYPLPTFTLGALLLGLTLILKRGPVAQARAYLRVYAIYLLLSQRWLFVSVQNLVGEWIPAIRGIFMGRFFDLPASLLIACQLALLVSAMGICVGRWNWARWLIGMSVTAFVAIMLIQPKIFLFYRIGVDGWGQLNYQVKSLEDLKAAETEPFRVASVLPLQPAYAYAQGLETADGWANLYPKVYRQYWLQVIAPLLANSPGAKKIFDPDSGRPQDHYIFLGADLTHPTVGALPGEDVSHALKEGFDIERRFNLTLLGLLNVKYLLSELPLKGKGLVLVQAPANPPTIARSRDWATGRTIDPPTEPHGNDAREKLRNAFIDLVDSIKLKTFGKEIYIYRLETFVPRFRFVEEVRNEANARGVLTSLALLSPEDIRRIAISEAAAIHGQIVHHYGKASFRTINMNSREVRIEVNSPLNAFLAIGMTWSPYWRAEIDGKQVPLIRINHAQMGLEIPANARLIILNYSPKYFPFPKTDGR